MNDLIEALQRVEAMICAETDVPTLIGIYGVRASLRAQLANLTGDIRWLAR